MIELVDGWMKESNSDFALGSKKYTLADVIFTCLLLRLKIDKKFFRKEVKSRAAIKTYWKRMAG